MLNFPDAPTLGQNFSGGGSSWVWDGVKWEAATIEVILITVVTPASGATVTMTNSSPLYVNNGAVLDALTIRLPPSPVPGQFVELGFRNSVTALTVQDNAGGALTDSPDSAYAPGAAIYMRYIDYTIGWSYWK